MPDRMCGLSVTTQQSADNLARAPRAAKRTALERSGRFFHGPLAVVGRLKQPEEGQRRELDRQHPPERGAEAPPTSILRTHSHIRR